MTSPSDLAVVKREWNITLDGKPFAVKSHYPIENPSTGEHLANVPDCGPEDVDVMVAAAARAQEKWGALPPRQRATMIRKLVTLLREHRAELALLDAVDGGFPRRMMEVDVDAGLEMAEIFADMALSLGGRTIPVSDNFHFTTQQPYGVVARIGAFNHPFFFAISKVAAPLIAGNAVILKAPDQTPLSSLRLAELAAQVLPENLLLTVSGRGVNAGSAIVRHPLIRRIGFIGAPGTGRQIQRDAADAGVKNITLELGGKNAQIVMEDADVAAAAAAAVQGMNFTWTAGQSCGSTSRLLVHKSIIDAVTDRVAAIVKEIRVGDPLDVETHMGPVVSEIQYRKTLDAIEFGKTDGARVVAGGGRPDNIGDKGWYVQPTVLTNVHPDSRLAQEEIFGPVLSVVSFGDEEEALRIANSVEYGLTASIWTRDISRAHRMASKVDAGYILINGASRHYWGLPFGGVKSSGVGREESLEELVSYTETKTTTVVL